MSSISRYNSKYSMFCIHFCTILFRKEYFTEDIPDIEDIWTSSFVDQIPQLDGAGDKGPPPSKCLVLGYSQYTLYFLISKINLLVIKL